MEKFPELFSPEFKHTFGDIYSEFVTSKLREEIYQHVVSSSENEYFALDNFYRKYKVEKDASENLTELIMSELEANGWKCKTSFGGTGLFIYSTEKPPSNCYEDGF